MHLLLLSIARLCTAPCVPSCFFRSRCSVFPQQLLPRPARRSLLHHVNTYHRVVPLLCSIRRHFVPQRRANQQLFGLDGGCSVRLVAFVLVKVRLSFSRKLSSFFIAAAALWR